jgi:hypothetical protein
MDTPFPRTVYRYIDPGASSALASLAPLGVHRVRLLNVEPYSLLAVNWTFTAVPFDEAEGEIRVFDSRGTKIAEEDGEVDDDDGQQATVSLAVQLGADSEYVVEFLNEEDDKGPILSMPFSSVGGAGATWIHSKLNGREYVVTASASGVTGATGEEVAAPVILRAYVRQLPGAHPDNAALKQIIVMESWRRLETSGE